MTSGVFEGQSGDRCTRERSLLCSGRAASTSSLGLCAVGARKQFCSLLLDPIGEGGIQPWGAGEAGLPRLGKFYCCRSSRTVQYFCMLLLIVGHYQVIFVVPEFISVSLVSSPRAEMVLWMVVCTPEPWHL